ncbi:MAG: hypothetical protein NZM11_07765 [Anaerolineales bacterium]|nr:hypothetical protein [Anaerolineales bacterium]
MLGDVKSPRKTWAYQLGWSFDGRYLAAFTTQDSPLARSWAVKTKIYDAHAQLVTEVKLPEDFTPRQISWLPNHPLFLVVGARGPGSSGNEGPREIYLVEAATAEVKRILDESDPDIAWVTNSNWAWSTDGRTVATACPKLDKDGFLIVNQICIIPVEVK